MRTRLVLATASVAFLSALTALTGCSGLPSSSDSAPPSASSSASGSNSPGVSESPNPTDSASPSSKPTPTKTPSEAPITLPTDCREILSDAVLNQLTDVPLNDPAFAPNGVQADGTLICVWGDPRADTTRLITTITKMNRGPALDKLNTLADDEAFTCYTPDGGTRCEKTWNNPEYPVTDGRTLFWRNDVLIDTQYSNLAPSDYTTSLIEHVFK